MKTKSEEMPTLREKLKELRELREDELITREEYASSRKKALEYKEESK